MKKFSTYGSDFEIIRIEKNPQILVRKNKTDITAKKVRIEVKNFRFAPADNDRITTGALNAPHNARLIEENIEAYN